MAKLLVFVFFSLLLNGCSGTSDGALSSLIYGVFLISIFLIVFALSFISKGFLAVSELFYPKKEKLRKVKKDILKRIIQDKKMINKTYDRKNSKFTSGEWALMKIRAKERIEQYELHRNPPTDEKFIKLPFTGKPFYYNYNDKIDYKTWVIRIAQAKKRIRDKKKLKKEKLPLKEFNEYSDK